MRKEGKSEKMKKVLPDFACPAYPLMSIKRDDRIFGLLRMVYQIVFQADG